ncbi:MAG: Hint domain-containing protein [Acidocella sp.]|nr:Hint domain-containing protein [Acidocella sp.]
MAGWIWTGAAGDGSFSTAANWSPATVPNNSDNAGIFVPGGSSITLTSSPNLSAITVTGTGTATFTGTHTLNINGLDFQNGGETLELGSTTKLAISGAIRPTGTGNYGITGGTVTVSTGATLASGQDLILTNTTLSSPTAFSGAGLLTLNGATVDFTGASPTVAIYFDPVTSGGTKNVLSLPQWPSNLVIENFSYGDQISCGGQVLKLVSTGSENASGQTIYDLENSSGSTFGTVTLASGTPGASGEASGYTITLLNSNGTDYTYPCFCAGTRLAAEEGEIEVQDVVPGTRLRLADGRVAEVRWVGCSRVATRFADPLRAFPIRIAAGALGDNLPVRDLLVSPDHAMFLDGVLVQASALVGFPGITREHGMPEFFDYYHVELGAHELLLAEGAPTESFVDNIDRMNFHNWDERFAPVEPIAEMEYPRAKSARQLPSGLRARLGARPGEPKAA